MSRIQTPRFLNDLYRDLRDRRLLIPVVALLVALVAVPVLLSSGGGEPVPPIAPAAVDTKGAVLVESAVVADEPGLRNYRKRLEALKQTNPFAQKFAVPDPSGGVEEVGGPVEVAGANPAAAPGGSTLSSATGGDVPASEPVSSTDEPTIAPTPSPTEPDPAQQPEPEIRFYAGRVDVIIGPIGDGKTFKDVRHLDFLPNDKTPVVAFIGLAEGGDHAVFSVSRDVTETAGEGSCAPKKPNPCQFLTLKPGQERTLSYGAEGETYRLKLLDTDIVRVPDPRDQ